MENPQTHRRSFSRRIILCRNDWLGRRETGESLALFRIACGLCTLAWIASAILRGVVPDVWLPADHGGYRSFSTLPWLFELLGGLNPTTLWSVIGVYILAAAAVTIGLGGRLSALLLLQAFLAIADINGDVSGGDCRLTGNCLWLLVIAGGTATMSVDCRFRTGCWTSQRRGAAWPRYLIFYQLVIVYCTTGLQKVSIVWTPAGGYSALYFIMQEPSWQRWDMSWLAGVYPLTQLATAVTWIWEVSAPLLILAAWYRATRNRCGRLRRLFNVIGFRRVYVATGVMMHLGVFLFIDLSLFTGVALSMYTCLFTPAEWRAAWAKLNRFFRSRWVTVPRTTSSVQPTPGRTRTFSLRPRWKRSLVRLFVTFHLAAISLGALPAPPNSLTADDFQSEDVAADIAAWTLRLNGWGIDVSEEQIANRLWQAANRYRRIRRAAMIPFEPYYEFCGTSQGWRMFVGAHRFPTRLHIDVQQDGKWRPVYIQGSREHDWLRSRLHHEHWRTAIFTMVVFQDDDTYGEFAHWVARQAAADFPSAEQVRVRVYKFRTPTPAEVKYGEPLEGGFGNVITIPLHGAMWPPELSRIRLPQCFTALPSGAIGLARTPFSHGGASPMPVTLKTSWWLL